MLEADRQERALRELDQFAYELAAGREPRCADITPTLQALRLGDPRGTWLLRIMRETSAHVRESGSARRKFFHAARAFAVLRCDPVRVADSARAKSAA